MTLLKMMTVLAIWTMSTGTGNGTILTLTPLMDMALNGEQRIRPGSLGYTLPSNLEVHLGEEIEDIYVSKELRRMNKAYVFKVLTS